MATLCLFYLLGPCLGPLSVAKSAEIELLFGRNSCSADFWGPPTLTKFDFFKDAWWIWCVTRVMSVAQGCFWKIKLIILLRLSCGEKGHAAVSCSFLETQLQTVVHLCGVFFGYFLAYFIYVTFFFRGSTENFYLVLRNASHVEPGAASQSLLTIACRISGVCKRVL